MSQFLLGIVGWLCWLLAINGALLQAQTNVPDYPIQAIALSGDGTRMATLGRTSTNSEGETIYLVDMLDAATLEILSSIDIGPDLPNMLDVSPDGRWLIYNVPYTTLSALDSKTGERLTLFPGGVIEVAAVDWSPIDGRVAYVVGSSVTIVAIYGDHEGVELSDTENLGLMYEVAWSPDGHYLASLTVYEDGYTQIWSDNQLSGSGLVTNPAEGFTGGGDFRWSPTGELLAARRRSGITIYDPFMRTEQISMVLPNEKTPSSITWSPDGTQIAAGYVDIIWVFDVATGNVVNTITTSGIVDALIWTEAGLIHNGRGNGLYLNGDLISTPIVTPQRATPISPG